MTIAGHFETVSSWLEIVARTIAAGLGRYMSARTINVIEEDASSFSVAEGAGVIGHLRIADGRVEGVPTEALATALRGSQIHLMLRPQRFLFRPLELPLRAAEFLAGVVRAQIDRLTPWSADAAAFGWSKPTEAASDRITVTVAATARDMIAPYVRALSELGANSIAVFTTPQEAATGSAPIKVLEHERRGVLDIPRIHRVLTGVLLAAILLAVVAASANALMVGNLDSRRDELGRKIAERRAALRAAGDFGSDAAGGAQRVLDRRKHATPSSVLVLEALSQILPDHTYVTELRIEADRLRVIGVTQDAPSLIRLIEQSPQFTRATFFAPTTRSPSDPGERFNIEAHIEPVFSPPS